MRLKKLISGETYAPPELSDPAITRTTAFDMLKLCKTLRLVFTCKVVECRDMVRYQPVQRFSHTPCPTYLNISLAANARFLGFNDTSQVVKNYSQVVVGNRMHIRRTPIYCLKYKSTWRQKNCDTISIRSIFKDWPLGDPSNDIFRAIPHRVYDCMQVSCAT